MSLIDLNTPEDRGVQQQNIKKLFKPWNDNDFLLSIYAGLGFIIFHGLHAWYHIVGKNVPTSHAPENVQYALGIGFMVMILLYPSLKNTRGSLRIFLVSIVFILENVISWIFITQSTSIVVLNLCIALIVILAIIIKSNYMEKLERVRIKHGLLELLHDEVLGMINIFIQVIGLVLIGGFVPIGLYLWSVIPENNRIYETAILVMAWLYITLGASWFVLVESHRALKSIQSNI